MPNSPGERNNGPGGGASAAGAAPGGRRFGFGIFVGRRLRRRTRWLLRGLILLPLLLVAALMFLMRSHVVGWLAAKQLKTVLGCTATVRSSEVTFDGRVVLHGVSLRVPGMTGPEAEFLSAERADIDMDWSDLFGAGPRPLGVRLFRPVFRVSTDAKDSTLNIQSLHPSNPAAMTGNQPLRIDALTGALELGEHSKGGYTVLRTLAVSGSLVPLERQPGSYHVRFQETPGVQGVARNGEGRIGMVLDGRIDLTSSIAQMSLLNVDLAAWPPATVPSAMRAVWQQLNVKGKIQSTDLEYFPTTGLTAVVTLDEVSMDALVPANFPTGEADQDVLSLRQVHGRVTLSEAGVDAEVAGLVEDQTFPSRVELKTRGLSTDAALECTVVSRKFKLAKDPRLLPFCPPVVRERLLNFSSPTAVVDADVMIRRDSPGPSGPAPFRVAGRLSFEHGEAAFDRVPYPFREMKGLVDFDDQGIDIRQITGEGPDGAMLVARGRIAPPTDEAAVNLEFQVRNVPLDDVFLDSLPPARAEAIDFLFNRAKYEELVAAGLVSRPGQPAGGAPEFGLGGRMGLDITVNSPAGKDSPWHWSVDATLPTAGVLPRAFPYPIDATGIRLRLTDADATLEAGSFKGLEGGSVGVEARVALDDAGKAVIRPSVTIDARGVPIDDLLLHAVAEASRGAVDENPAAGDDPTPAQLLRRLALSGQVDCRASIGAAADDEIKFDIGVAFQNLESRPAAPGTVAALALTDIAGTAHLTNTRFEVPALHAVLRALPEAAAATPSIAAGQEVGWVSASASCDVRGLDLELVPEGDRARPESRAHGTRLENLHTAIDLDGVEVLAPLEAPIGVFSSSVASTLADLRAARQPSGRISATIELDQPERAAPPAARVRIFAAENLGFDALGDRLDATLRSGSVLIDTHGSPVATFEGAGFDVSFGGAPAVPLTLDGQALLDRPSATPREALRPLDVSGQGITIESPLVNAALARALPDDARATIVAAHPSGVFDVSLSMPPDALVAEGGVGEGVEGAISPRSLAFDFEGTRVELGRVTGRVVVQGDHVRFEDIEATAEDWTASIAGTLDSSAEAGSRLAVHVGFQADSLTPGIRALIPAGLRRDLDGIGLDVLGRLSCDDAAIVYSSGAGDVPGSARIDGQIAFDDASLDIGAPITGASGSLKLHAERGGQSRWRLVLDAAADKLLAAGLSMTDLRTRIENDESDGRLTVSDLRADCYAGRVAAHATFRHEPGADEGAPTGSGAAYDAEISMAGVCFAPALYALDAARETDSVEARPPMPTALSADPSRGRLDGTLSIAGVTGDPSRRWGTGSVRIAGGDVVDMPLVLALVQLSNLQLPMGDRLDFLQSIFHIERDLVVFDRIDLLSSSVAIAGHGTMSWPSQELDLRFNSSSGTRVPVLSDVLEALRNEIATTRIRGTLSEPRLGAEPLTGTRELIGALAGDRPAPRISRGSPDAETERRRYQGQPTYQPRGTARNRN